MRQSKWVLQSILVFIFSILALGLSLFLYIYWYMKVRTGFDAIVQRFNLEPGQVLKVETWVVILVLSILVGIILAGIFTIFVYHQKTLQLYRLQNNFINNFTHELKTPVTSLRLYLETFLKHELSRSDRVKYIDYMLQDVDRLSGNINRILGLSRLESKNYIRQRSSTDLVDIVERFVAENARLFQGCRLQVHVPEERPFPYPIHHALFEMLLMNLMINAVKYNASKEPRVDVRFEQTNGRLKLHFEDNGIGIDEKETKKIFRKFYRAGRSGKRRIGGSGLGLHLVESIARIHKGRVTVRSRPDGKGSVFTLDLPWEG